jgi:uncharacterized protein
MSLVKTVIHTQILTKSGFFALRISQRFKTLCLYLSMRFRKSSFKDFLSVWKPLLFCFPLLFFSLTSLEAESVIGLKQRQPNWRVEIKQSYPQGHPAQVIFYEQTSDQEEVPVKQIIFYQNGQLKEETDLTRIAEDAEAFKEWKTTIVPHGRSVTFFENGKVERTLVYDQGLADGELNLYYPQGTLRGSCGFKKGARHGKMLVYYEDGTKQEEASYQEGKLIGELIRYYPKEVRATLIPYAGGLPHGKAFEWYPSGALKATAHYSNGVLQSEGTNPALLVYYEDHTLQEVQDFQHGELTGTHFCYHPNGKESYRMLYKNGKKQGKEQFFSDRGDLLGEGEFDRGVPKGKHWRNHPNGAAAFLAKYDQAGTLLEPIGEWNENAVKTAEYTLVDNARDKEFREWYHSGQLKHDYFYSLGGFEGLQKSYYPSGQSKMRAFYKNQVKDGIYEEWHENGKLSMHTELQEGVKEGKNAHWYESGKQKLEEFYKRDALDQLKREWFENGKLKFSGAFKDGKKDGWHRQWNEKGDLLVEAFYEEDLPQGLARSWYEKDKLREVLSFVKGKREGKHQEYYENGILKAQAFYKEDLLDGRVESWHPNGSDFTLVNYNHGVPVGEQREYFVGDADDKQNTSKLSRIFYYNAQGKLEGEQKTFYPDGSLQSLTTYKNGELDQRKAAWNDKGELIEEAFYENGKLNGSFFERTQDGREVVYHFKNNRRHGVHEIYYPINEFFGKIKALEVNFVDDEPEGEAVEYDQGGHKISTTFYTKGLKEGIAQIFSPKGEVLMRINFHHNKKQGPAVEYFPKGKIYREVSYLDDEIDGEDKKYHENGKTQSINQYSRGKLHGLSRHWNDQGILTFEAEYREGLRHGKFNKYNDDGTPAVLQVFVDDKLDGVKKVYDKAGKVTKTKYDKGKKIG